MTAPQEWEQKVREDIESVMKMKWGDHITEAGWTRYLGKEWTRRSGPDCFRVRVPKHYFEQ
eukprot:7785182-Heterocapsa_arctica.AAC.1